MDNLFPLTVEPEQIPDIPGLSYRSAYLSAEEERRLSDAIDEAPWDTSWERRRQPYGAGYGRSGIAAPPLPAWGEALAERLYREGISDAPFDQLLVNEYLPGQGIALHRDYEPFDRTIVSISLLSPCVMDFRRVQDNRRESLLLERRSILILSDEARYDWEHGIARRKSDRWQGARIDRSRRVSITLRKLKQRHG